MRTRRNRPKELVRCLTRADLRRVPRESLLTALKATQGSLATMEELLQLGPVLPAFYRDRAVLRHNERLLLRHLGSIAA